MKLVNQTFTNFFIPLEMINFGKLNKGILGI